jgi:hypothetical protein
VSLKADEVALAIMALQQGHTDRGAEAQILDLLTRIDDATLDSVVLSLDLTALFSDVDNRWLGPDNLTALLHLLSRKRIAALSVDARGAIVDALQVGRTDRLDERAIADMLCATSGTALTDLKNVIDAGADHRDLQHLVYNDIDDDEIRAELLAHFKTHDAACGSLKVLSDIDDTFYANWKDDRFPKETVYPGVRQLYDELGGDLAFVTARPRDRPGVVEHATHEMLRSHGLEDVTVLAGCVSKLLTNASIADKKLQNFVEYAQLYPEYGYVFIGDSGQGDAMFGREMRVREPDRVKAVLIHDVVATDRATRREWRNDGVLLFDTYVGAAVEARAIGLLTDDAVQRVVDAATNELDAIKFDGADQHYARRRELDRDVARADG